MESHYYPPLVLRPSIPSSLLPALTNLQNLLLSINESTDDSTSSLAQTYLSFASNLPTSPPPVIDILENLQSLLLDDASTDGTVTPLDTLTLTLLAYMAEKFHANNDISSAALEAARSVASCLPVDREDHAREKGVGEEVGR